jgi:hypothetical protein
VGRDWHCNSLAAGQCCGQCSHGGRRAGEAGQAAGLPASSLEFFRVTEVTIKLEMPVKVNSLKFNLKLEFKFRRHEST